MANSYLTSNTGTATNANKFTYSVWLKRSQLCDTTGQRFYQGYQDGNNRFYIMFDNTNSNPDQLWIYNVIGGATKLFWVSNRKFRDLNAWYHIVLSADSTQGTEADRFKVYINGVEETGWTKTNNQPQNINWGNQLAQTNGDLTISGTESQTQPFDGYMSHVAFVDGQALAPTVFGQTDSTSGIWKFKSPSGVTWGNNGYHLKFENSANLGLDSSGNSNNFTVQGNLKQALDTPSNVYSTLNPLVNIGTTTTYSEGSNTVSTSNANYKVSPSTLAVSSGKWYVEFKAVSGSFGSVDAAVGIIQTDTNFSTASQNLNAYPNGYSYGSLGKVRQYNGSDVYTASSYNDGDIVCIALDMDNNKLYFRKNNDAWENSGNPTSGSTGTGAVSITSGKEYYFACSTIASGGTKVFSVNFGNGFFGTTAITSAGSNGNGSLFEYDVPSGYYALNTKNINTYG